MTNLLLFIAGGAGTLGLLLLAVIHVLDRFERRRRQAESIATAFRIHEIYTTARQAMWAEARRHRSGGS